MKTLPCVLLNTVQETKILISVALLTNDSFVGQYRNWFVYVVVPRFQRKQVHFTCLEKPGLVSYGFISMEQNPAMAGDKCP